MDDPVKAARQYARIRYRLRLVGLIGMWAFLAILQWSGLSARAADWAATLSESVFIHVAGYLLVIGLAHYLITLPLHIYASYHLEHRFGLSRMSVGAWCVREGKRLILSGLIAVILFEGLYAILRAVPVHWPLVATIGWVWFTVVMAQVFPTLILPIFYKTIPLHEEQIIERLTGLCQRVGFRTLGIFRFRLGAETRKANAALAGLGNTRRVLLSDTLVEEFPIEEIEGVLAHELAHHRYRHIFKMLVVAALGSWLAFSLTGVVSESWIGPLGLSGLSDLAGFPVLMLWLSVLSTIGLPLQNALSRHFERQADRFALAHSTSPAAFASALRRLAVLNLADPAPPRWVEWMFFDHPPILQRIAAAEQAALPQGGT